MIVHELYVVNQAIWDAMALAAGERSSSLTLAITFAWQASHMTTHRIRRFAGGAADDLNHLQPSVTGGMA